MYSAASRQALLPLRSANFPYSRIHQQYTHLSRSLSTLAILEQVEGKLNNGSLSAVTAAQKLGGPVTGFVAGSNVKTIAEEIAKVDGLEKVISVNNAAYDRGLPENFAPLLAENIKKGGYTHVFAPSSAFGKNVMPRVAALLDVQQISDITEVQNEDSMLDIRLSICASNHSQHLFERYMQETRY